MKPFQSASGFSAFQMCPFNYLNAGRKRTSEMSEGIKVHKFIDAGWKDQLTTDEDKHRFDAMMETFGEKALHVKDSTIASEKAFQHQVGDVFVNGIMDLVEMGTAEVIVTDWKTGARFYSQEDIDKSIQGIVYAHYILSQVQLVEVVRFQLYMTKYNKAIHVTYRRSDMDYLKTKIEQQISEMKDAFDTNTFEARAGSHCSYCPIVKQCKRNVVDRDERNVTITSVKELQECIDTLTVTGLYLDEMKERVKSYIHANSIIETPIYLVTQEVKNDYRMSTSKAAQLWMTEQFPALLKPDSSEVKALLLANKDKYQEALAAKVISDSTKVEIKWKRK